MFCLGVAIFDQRVSLFLTNNRPEARELLVQLHKELVFAVQEMRHIDDTLNRTQWLQAIQHLSVRRLKNEECATDVTGSGKTFVFVAIDVPTYTNYLSLAQNDPVELTGILEMALLNEVDLLMLQEKIRAASIDLATVVASVKRLNSISPTKYPLDQDRLRTITEQLG